ncbi:right-handed parallel beta-helix repeat-containing protein [Streptomyces sp. Z26]|uniref:right-handed parallel beta-helix repeat-containing protein n=1 Tax=Streptomyces sp. Z26 TaxID=2500177 RepID=UPI000EF1664B|nr:right-handed parallel beta-helix repeat-containing protein [Streptomyces sp. Z26]RLL68126.1 right-handed parallel beta-helix repeat-containing protein [Streptomyces sp. Z26]
MPLFTYGGSPAEVLTDQAGNVIPDYPLIVRAAGTGQQVTALYEADGTTPIAQLRTNPAGSTQPGAIRPFKADGVIAIEYEYNAPNGDPVRWYQQPREIAAVSGADKLPIAGGVITGNLGIVGALDVGGQILQGGQPLDGLRGAGLFDVRRFGATGSGAGDDAPGIQAAMDAAYAAGGGQVLVPPGTYVVATLPLRIRRGTRLTLAPGATIRRGANGTMLLNGDSAQAYGGYSGHGDLVIEGGVWDCRGAVYTASAMCMSLGHAENILIRDLTIRDVSGYHGIEINAVRHAVMRNVRGLGYYNPGGRDFSEFIQPDLAKGSAYFGGFGPYDDCPCVDVLIEGCAVGPSGTPGTTSWPRAIGSHSASPGKPHRDIRVRDLRAEGCAQWVVGAYTWESCVISGVQARDCGGGVRVQTLDSSKASHRTPAGGSSPTIAGSQPLAGVVVSDVTMTGGGAYGAAVEVVGEATGYVQDVAVGRVVARSVGQQAVRAEFVEDYVVSDVVAHTTGATAISTLGTRRGQITDSEVNGSGGAGITIDSRSTPAATATDVTVSRCQIAGTAANGVHCWDGADIVIDDCDLHDLTGYGVQVSTNTARPVVRNVRAKGTTLAGVSLTSTVTDARRYGNTGSIADATTTPTATSPFDSGQGALEDAMRPPSRYETTSRLRVGTSSAAMTSGVLYLVPVWLPKGVAISSISFVSGGTAAGTPTNYWFTLHDKDRKALARSADQTTTAWAASTVKTLAIAQTTAGTASSYTTTYEGLHYLGIMVKATTMPSIAGEGSMGAGSGVAPGFGDTNTGMSTPPTVSGAGFTAAAFGGNTGLLAYGYAA